jgi:predicted dinucleotide-binding enzyme
MDVTIIGTGSMGRGIGSRLVSGGRTITLLGTERGNAEELAAGLGGGLDPGTVGDPVADDVVQLEALGYLHLAVQEGLGTGYRSAVKVLG